MAELGSIITPNVEVRYGTVLVPVRCQVRYIMAIMSFKTYIVIFNSIHTGTYATLIIETNSNNIEFKKKNQYYGSILESILLYGTVQQILELLSNMFQHIITVMKF